MGQGRSKFSLSNLNILKRLDAKGRVLFLIGVTVFVIILIYIGTRYIWNSNTASTSRVATPSGLQSVPGSPNFSAQYQQATNQANAQQQQLAQVTGGSAIPTQINYGNQNATCVICSDQSANIKNDLDNWVAQGSISPDTEEALEKLAEQNVPVSQFADELNQMVKDGKLTPEQARQLLEEYKKQHMNALQNDSAQMMDGLIKNGQLPLDAATNLLAAQKNNMSPADYAKKLQDLVNQGLITPATAQQLLSQYNQQLAKEAAKENVAGIAAMAKKGEITPDVAKELAGLAGKGAPIADYAAALQKDVAAGKLTPAAAAKLLTAYEAQRGSTGPSDTLAQLVKQAPNADAAKKLQAEADRLNALQANNAAPDDYANELKNAVATGLISPGQAADLLQQYQALSNPDTQQITAPVAGNGDFAQLQQRVQSGTAAVDTDNNTGAADFEAARQKALEQAEADRRARLEALVGAMSNQSQQLLASWQQAPTMAYKEAAPVIKTIKTTSTDTGTTTDKNGATAGLSGAAPLIKAGSILFAVLDTAVNSDYPDSPVMATIVAGPYKGAKLLGKLTTAKNVAGQLDRVSLNFTLMNMDAWTTSKGVTAYAIDPDTARTVLASQVDYHYLKRFGSIMATSFMQGFGNAIANQGTATTGIFGTSTTHDPLGTAGNIYAGLGQVGQTIGGLTQNYINIPPTVKVDSGVGLGILFMADLS